MQKQRDLVQQPLGRARVLDDDGFREAPQPLFLVARQCAAGVDDDRRERHVLLLRHLLQQLVAAEVRQIEVHHHAVEGRRLELRQASPAVATAVICTSSLASSCANALALPRVVLDHQHAPQTLRELRFQALERLDQLLALRRLQGVADRAELERLLLVVRHRHHVNRNVPRPRIALQLIENAEARMIGKIDVQQYGARLIFRGRDQSVVRAVRHDALKAHLARQVAQDHRKRQVVLDHQNQPAAGRQRFAVILDRRRAESVGCRSASAHVAPMLRPCDVRRSRLRPARLAIGRHRRAAIDDRQGQREDTACGRLALHR